MVKDLSFVPRGTQREAMERAWSVWCRENPDRKTWPVWLVKYVAEKQRQKRLEAL
jgi:hypothetical protein